MSKFADQLLAEALGSAIFGKQNAPVREDKINKVLARLLEKHLLVDDKKKEEKKKEEKKFGMVETVVLITIGSYFFCLANLIAMHELFPPHN